MELIEQKEWFGHQLLKQRVTNEAGKQVPFLAVLPANTIDKLPCIIALHGFTSSKGEWLEFDSYTKGGNLVKALADNGYAVIAIDLYCHGENHTNTPIDYDDLANNQWEKFFHGSLESIEAVMNNFVKKELFDQERIGFLSYSTGGLFGFWLANRNCEFKAFVMCVPPVDKDEDDEYAPYNNLNDFENVPMLLITGEEDEHVSFEDSKWLYDQLPMTDKQLISYKSGHSLPVDYIAEVAGWVQQRL